MAGDTQKDGSPIPPSIIAALLLALGALFVSQFPATPSRPATPEKVPPTIAGVQDVDARLWQDPFDAVARHLDDRGKRREDAADPSKRCSVGADAYLGKYGEVAVFVVPVFGGPYAEDAEHRRRTRYAVLSAIGVGGRGPADGVHIGYFDASSTCGKSGDGKPRAIAQRDLVPFEWFVPPRERQGEAVLVLWVDENAMEGAPLASIARVLKRGNLCRGARMRRAIIGPAGSDALVDLLHEPNSDATACARDALILSYAATADVQPPKNGVTPIRTTHTDSILIQHLLKELGRRTPWPSRGAAAIALVSEWDTNYGRRFAETFLKEVCAVRGESCDLSNPAHAGVHRFSYLRGLDGVLPAPPSSSDKTPPPSQTPRRPSELLTGAERPVADGGSQFDYLHRLADRMAATRDTFGAIGVVGSDPYDKIALLGVLRAKFPDAVFFTTDLDARLIHGPREARNLIVASTFGLQLAPHLQKDIPPFRDSYQTAAYYASRRALERLAPCKDAAAAAGLPDPRVFELGRGVAVDLTPQARRTTASAECPDAGEIHPRSTVFFFDLPGLRSLWDERLALVAVLAVASVVLLYSVSFTIRSTINDVVSAVPTWRGALCAFVAAVVVLGLPALALWQISEERDTGEPFALWSGVSMWPGELIRFIAVLVAAALLVQLYHAVGRIRRELTKDFFPDHKDDADAWFPVALANERRNLWGLVRQIFAASVECGRDDPPPDATKLWRRYLFQSSVTAAVIRVAPIALAFWALGVSILALFGFPVPPARGTKFWIIDFCLVQLLVALMTWLTVAVADAIRTCDRFARAVSGEKLTRWPKAVHDTYDARLGIGVTRHLSSWLDVTFLARWTEGLGGIVFYPFVVILLMVVARSTIFDRWTTTPGLLMVYALGIGVAFASPLILRTATERVRRTAVAQITEQIVVLEGTSADARRPHYATAAQLRLLRDEVATMHRGAFARLRDQPVLRAAALPVSGSGLLALVEFLFALR